MVEDFKVDQKTVEKKIRDESYQKLINSSLGLRQKTVYLLIKSYNGLTSEEVALRMRLRLNEVSGRITELKNMRLIAPSGSIKNMRSNNQNCKWVALLPVHREKLIREDLMDYRDKQRSLKKDLYIAEFVSEFTIDLIKKEIIRTDRLIDLISK